ncbi:hypothetical protein CLOP_g25725 [Closterium sp. NIES-67]|nr:hypothetical protein CLOP_g25725 [Closterium sp. NIES-67]
MGRVPPSGLVRARRREEVTSWLTSCGRLPASNRWTSLWRFVATAGLDSEASRRCSKVIPEGPAPTPFSERARSFANVAKSTVGGLQFSSSRGQVRLSTSGGGCFDFSASRTVGVDLLTGVEVNASSARRKLPRRTKPSARDIFPRVSGTWRGGGGRVTAEAAAWYSVSHWPARNCRSRRSVAGQSGRRGEGRRSVRRGR